MHANFLRAGHGARRPRQPVAPHVLAARIVASLREHPERTPEQYTQRAETLALVQQLLHQGIEGDFPCTAPS